MSDSVGITEWQASCRSIEAAFLSFRESLSLLMKEMYSAVDLAAEIDVLREKNKLNSLKSIHDDFRSTVQMIPSLWEHNEGVLRDLVNPLRNLNFQYAILDSSKVCDDESFLMQNASTPPSFVMNWSASYNSLDQVLIHLSRRVIGIYIVIMGDIKSNVNAETGVRQVRL
jgi:hypothetical protein